MANSSLTSRYQTLLNAYDVLNFKQIIRVIYDYTEHTNTVAGTPVSLSSELPDNAIVTRGYYEVITPFTSATNVAEIAIGINTNDVNGLLAATVVTSAGTAGYHELIQTGTAANFSTKTTSVRAIDFDITVEDLTAGKMIIFLEYVISE